MSTLQSHARALGDPTRHAIFVRICDADAPVSVRELNEHFPLNHNAIRQHLAKLVDAGLVRERTAPPTGRGRPPLVYEPTAAGRERWSGANPYEQLSVLLAEVATTGDAAEVVGRRAARRRRAADQRYGAGAAPDDPVDGLVRAMELQGFEPERRTRGTGTEVVLHRCPFATTAAGAPATVCALHLGIAEGLLEGSATAALELVARDPRRAGCVLRLVDGEQAAAPATVTLAPRRSRRR